MRLIPIALAFTALATNAQIYDGNNLLTRMQSSNHIDQGVAMGYVTGVYDTGKGWNHCPSRGVSVGQLNDMIKIFLESNPGIRHYSGDSIVNFVLQRAWPCKDQKGQSL